MTTVYLIRHGQSEGNERNVYCGWTDFPLSQLGEAQARHLAGQLPTPRPYHLVTSDLSRASRTAHILSESWRLPVTVDRSFREMHFGAFENRTWKNITEKYPALTTEWTENWFAGHTPEGESLEMVYNRVIPAYREYLHLWQGTAWGLVAHSGVIQAILSTELFGSHQYHWRFAVANASLIRLDYGDDGYAVLKGFNTTAHCAESPVKI